MFNKLKTQSVRLNAGSLCLAMACISVSAHAASTTPVEGERLSDWLLRQPTSALSYSTALQWQVPSERAEQAKLKRNVLAELNANTQIHTSARANLIKLLEALPVTGRVPLSMSDARWLQAHPKQDPVLNAVHTLVLPNRPTTVSVLMQSGVFCTVSHRPGAQVKNYLNACEPSQVGNFDRAFVVQPDGTVLIYGVAVWNQEAQSELAPGAFVWAPSKNNAFSENFSWQLVQFLATQNYESALNADTTRPMYLGASAVALPPDPARSLPITASDWGFVGLMQTPTARMSPAGDARFNMSRVYPYERINVFAQPFDWLEAGFRYTNVSNRLYGPLDLSGTQAYKDKSIDFKLRLLEESAYLPQVAVGMIDFGGTGLFSSEYVVANKRFGNLDASLGMGWGYLGSSGNITNPLAKLSSSFTSRSADFGMGGTPAFKSFFRGPAAFFGGVQYHTPWRNWVLKAEYDGNNYQNEPQANNRKQSSPFNFGVVYKPSPNVDLSVGLERGNTVMVGFTLKSSLSSLSTPKVSDPPTPRISTTRPQQAPEWVSTVADISDMSGWVVKKMTLKESVLQVDLEALSGVHWNDRLERIVTILHRDAPANVETFELNLNDQGVPLTQRIVKREAWVKQNTQLVPPSLKEPAIVATEPPAQTVVKADSKNPGNGVKANKPVWEQTPSLFGYGIVPSWQQNIGGPDGFLLFRAGLSVPMQVRLTNNITITGAVSLNLIDNYGKFKYTAPSDMPRVRTYLREYMTNSKFNVPNLQITHFSDMAPNQYYSVYAGYLEGMYAGVGGEWMYRKWHSPFAFGVDLNRVQQRSFDQYFGFGNAGSQTGYKVTTGHATAYVETGWQDTQVKVSAGRYLAGDVGVTLDVGKTFANGVSLGVWATKTNVSAQRFGEGSFDKGLYLRIPFDVMTTTRTGNVANLAYNPLTRDGGAKLGRDFTLYGATSPRSKRDTGYVPAPPVVPAYIYMGD
jgi:hypothetical protein